MSFITYNRPFHSQCSSSRQCFSISLIKSCMHPFHLLPISPYKGLCPHKLPFPWADITHGHQCNGHFSVAYLVWSKLCFKATIPSILNCFPIWSVRVYIRPVYTDQTAEATKESIMWETDQPAPLVWAKTGHMQLNTTPKILSSRLRAFYPCSHCWF